MVKILEKLKESIFGKRSVTKLGDLTLKNKKLTDNQKLKEILFIYGKYYKDKHVASVNMSTWELHYEDFMIDEKTKDKLLFDSFYRSTEEEINFTNMVCLTQQINSLKNINVEKCTKTELEILHGIKDLSQVYTQDFDYEEFYFSFLNRSEIKDQNNSMINKILTNYEKTLSNNQQQMEK